MEKIDIMQRAYQITEKVAQRGCFYDNNDRLNYISDILFISLNVIKKEKENQLFNYVVGPKFYTMEIGVACAKRVFAHDKAHDSELTFRYVSMVAKHFGLGNGKEFFEIAKAYQEKIDRIYFCID